MLYSYDIFDTLITRITYSPVGIFYIMQEKLQKLHRFSGYFSDNFAAIRTETEKHAKQDSEYVGREDIYLKDIYNAMSDYEELSEEDIDFLVKLEQQTEYNCIVPIDKNISELKEHIKNNDKVILISDMYLNETVIRNILINIDEVFKEIPIYVSCDYSMCKSTGRLYAYIHEKMHVEYKDWVHIGDNYKSDFIIPKTLGIKCEYRQNWIEYNWIKEYKKKCDVKSLEYQLGFGVARYLCINSERDELKELALSFSGIVLNGYVNWIIQNAVKKGHEELYFIARDGYILQKLADKIIKDNRLAIKTKYIYGSRKVWRNVDTEEKKDNLKKYFEQNIAFDKNIAFIDANGYGISIANVASILDDVWKKPVPVYLFSFHRLNNSQKCSFYNYCYNQTGLIELLSSATHGSTIAYENSDGVIVPVLEKNDNAENIDKYVEGVLLYADTLYETLKRLDIKADFRHIITGIMYRPWYNGGITLRKLWSIINSTPDASNSEHYQINKAKKTPVNRVIIYGAGKAGKRIFNDYNNDEKYDIIAWTDINYEEYAKQGLPVSSINDAIKKKYDYIVIAMVNKIAISSAKCILKELDVPDEKIIEIESST